MPAPKTTDKYPMWLKQALYSILDNPETLPLHLPFHSAQELSQFNRLYYGYQKALAKEEEKMQQAYQRSPDTAPTPTHYAQELGSLILCTPSTEERRYPEAYAERVICFRDDDPRTQGVQSIFQDLIDKTNSKAFAQFEDAVDPEPPSPTTHNNVGTSMEDMLGTLGYDLNAEGEEPQDG